MYTKTPIFYSFGLNRRNEVEFASMDGYVVTNDKPCRFLETVFSMYNEIDPIYKNYTFTLEVEKATQNTRFIIRNKKTREGYYVVLKPDEGPKSIRLPGNEHERIYVGTSNRFVGRTVMKPEGRYFFQDEEETKTNEAFLEKIINNYIAKYRDSAPEELEAIKMDENENESNLIELESSSNAKTNFKINKESQEELEEEAEPTKE